MTALLCVGGATRVVVRQHTRTCEAAPSSKERKKGEKIQSRRVWGDRNLRGCV